MVFSTSSKHTCDESNPQNYSFSPQRQEQGQEAEGLQRRPGRGGDEGGVRETRRPVNSRQRIH